MCPSCPDHRPHPSHHTCAGGIPALTAGLASAEFTGTTIQDVNTAPQHPPALDNMGRRAHTNRPRCRLRAPQTQTGPDAYTPIAHNANADCGRRRRELAPMHTHQWHTMPT
eukprot:365992-Chlamydomonas_euryale.AAC.3